MTKIGEFFRGKRILITGATGFKGSWLTHALLHSGAEVSGYSLPAVDSNSIFNLTDLGSRFDSEIGDIRNYDAILKFLKRKRPEVVFHLAAQPLVLAGYQDPAATYTTNVMGTFNILEACRSVDSVRCIVVATTDKVYENREWCWPYRESDRLGGDDPYSSSKSCAEMVTQSMFASFLKHQGVGVVTVRAGNVVGGGDRAPNRLVPDFFRAYESGQTLTIRNPFSTRPWQHVLDPIFGYLFLARRVWFDCAGLSGAWNFGPTDVGMSVEALLDRFSEKVHVDLQIDRKHSEKKKESTRLAVDISKMTQELGWKGLFSNEEMVAMTSEWYLNPCSAKINTERQLSYSFSKLEQKNHVW